MSMEQASLFLATAFLLLVYFHGKAFLRAVSILFLSALVTLWAVLRRVSKALRRQKSRTPSASTASPRTITESLTTALPSRKLKPAELASALSDVWRLHGESKSMQAAGLLTAIEGCIAANPLSLAAAAAKRELEANAANAAAVRSRITTAVEALRLFQDDSGWQGSLEAFGSLTRYRRDTGADGRMTIRVDGVIETVSLGQVLAVWREVKHMDQWLPSCVGSRLIRLVGVSDVLFHLHFSVLGLISRDAVMHAYAVDALDEANAILIIGRSVTAMDMPTEPIPPPTDVVRMEYRRLQILLEPIDERTTRISLMLSIDPKAKAVPMSFIEGILRRSICMLYLLLKRAAKRVAAGDGVHAAAVSADRTYHGTNFYASYLAPRLRAHFANQNAKA